MYRNDRNAKNVRLPISEVSEREAADIQALTGVDVTGYVHTADRSFFTHVERRHGANGEHDSTMSDLNDVARAGWVIENYDTVELVTEDNGTPVLASDRLDVNKNHMQLIQYTKQVDGTVYVVEAVGDNDWKRVWLKSAYIQKEKPSVKQGLEASVTQTRHTTSGLQFTSETENASPDAQVPVTQMAHAEALAVTSETGSPSPDTNSITQPGDTVNGSIAGMDGIMPPGGGEMPAGEAMGQAAQSVRFFHGKAQEAHGGFAQGIQSTLKQGETFIDGGVKSEASMANKVLRKQKNGKPYGVGDMKDHVRGAIVLEKGFEQVPDMIRRLQGQFPGLQGEAFLETPLNNTGYRGIHLTVALGHGINGEIQITTPEAWQIKKQTDAVYAKWRDIPHQEMTPEQKKAYQADYASSRALWDAYYEGLSPEVIRMASSSVMGLASIQSPSVPPMGFQAPPINSTTSKLESGYASSVSYSEMAKSMERSDMTSTSIHSSPEAIIPQNSGKNNGFGQAQRQFGSKTAQKSYAIDEETKAWLRNNSGYAQDSNRAQIDRAIETIEQKGYDAAKNEWLDKDIKEMNNADGHAMGAILMGIAARNGDVAAEIAVANKYNELGTVSGQSLQARKIFNMMTPIGAASYVQGLADRINNAYYRQNKGTKVAVSDDTMSAIVGAESTQARQAAVDKAQSEIAAQMPPSWKDRLTAWRYLSMLGNPRTHIRNVLGNAVFAPVVAAKNKVGAAMEAIAQKAGWIDARTKTGKLVVDKPLRDFAKADAQTRRDVLTGEAKYNTESKIDRERRSFGNSKVGNALQWLVDQNGKALEAEDRLFLSWHYERALGGYLQANNLNPSTMTQAQLDTAREYAIKEAQKATYRDTSSFVEALNRFSKSNKGAAFLVESVLPFKKTPVNILKRGLEYSPVGFLNTLKKWGKQCYQMNKAERGGRNAEDFRTMTGNEFIDGLASGLTGTMAMGLGYLLSSLGIITAGIDDDKEGDFEKLTGEQAYSIKIGNMSVRASNIGNTIRHRQRELSRGGGRFCGGPDAAKYGPILTESGKYNGGRLFGRPDQTALPVA